MTTRSLFALSLVALLVASSTPIHAQPCSGFTTDPADFAGVPAVDLLPMQGWGGPQPIVRDGVEYTGGSIAVFDQCPGAYGTLAMCDFSGPVTGLVTGTVLLRWGGSITGRNRASTRSGLRDHSLTIMMPRVNVVPGENDLFVAVGAIEVNYERRSFRAELHLLRPSRQFCQPRPRFHRIRRRALRTGPYRSPTAVRRRGPRGSVDTMVIGNNAVHSFYAPLTVTLLGDAWNQGDWQNSRLASRLGTRGLRRARSVGPGALAGALDRWPPPGGLGRRRRRAGRWRLLPTPRCWGSAGRSEGDGARLVACNT